MVTREPMSDAIINGVLFLNWHHSDTLHRYIKSVQKRFCFSEQRSVEKRKLRFAVAF